MKRGICALGILSLVGCAPSALTVDDAKQYAGLSLNEFLAKRFGDSQGKQTDVVRYKAYFNDVNYTQLQRPTTELVNFCKAQGGTPQRVKAYAGSPFGDYYKSPVVAGVQGSAYARSQGASQSVAGAVGQDMMEKASAQNQEVDRRSLGYRASKDLYGDWTCNGITRPWTASVIPFQFVPQPNPNLPNDVMMIEIRAR